MAVWHGSRTHVYPPRWSSRATGCDNTREPTLIQGRTSESRPRCHPAPGGSPPFWGQPEGNPATFRSSLPPTVWGFWGCRDAIARWSLLVACFPLGVAANARAHRRIREARSVSTGPCATCLDIRGRPRRTTSIRWRSTGSTPGPDPDATGARERESAWEGRVRFDARCPTCGLACNQSRGAKSVESALAVSESEDLEL